MLVELVAEEGEHVEVWVFGGGSGRGALHTGTLCCRHCRFFFCLGGCWLGWIVGDVFY